MIKMIGAAALAGLLLAGCGSSPAVRTPVSPTPIAVADWDAYADLIDALDAEGYQGRDADTWIEQVCTSVLTPQEAIEAAPAMARMTRLAVMAGCPDRKDWS